MPLLVQLFIEFFLTGLFAVGGGLATLPFLYEMSRNTGWFSMADIANLVAVSESTPGPLGINMATFVGYVTAGIPGSLIAPLGLVVPSIIIIVIISQFLKKFKDNKYVQYAFYGLRAASTALIIAAGIGLAKIAFVTREVKTFAEFSFDAVNYIGIVLFAVIMFLLFKFKKHPIIYIVGAAVAGIVLQL